MQNWMYVEVECMARLKKVQVKARVIEVTCQVVRTVESVFKVQWNCSEGVFTQDCEGYCAE